MFLIKRLWWFWVSIQVFIVQITSMHTYTSPAFLKNVIMFFKWRINSRKVVIRLMAALLVLLFFLRPLLVKVSVVLQPSAAFFLLLICMCMMSEIIPSGWKQQSTVLTLLCVVLSLNKSFHLAFITLAWYQATRNCPGTPDGQSGPVVIVMAELLVASLQTAHGKTPQQELSSYKSLLRYLNVEKSLSVWPGKSVGSVRSFTIWKQINKSR